MQIKENLVARYNFNRRRGRICLGGKVFLNAVFTGKIEEIEYIRCDTVDGMNMEKKIAGMLKVSLQTKKFSYGDLKRYEARPGIIKKLLKKILVRVSSWLYGKNVDILMID